jgi:hypothetical protein
LQFTASGSSNWAVVMCSIAPTPEGASFLTNML